MVIKGSARGATPTDVRRLADHLLSSENETVEVLQIAGSASPDLHQALADFRSVSLGSRTRQALYHASLNLDRDDVTAMDNRRWLEAVAILQAELGLSGHPRAVVIHRKRDREHVHVVWQRVDGSTLKAASTSQSYRKHEQAARRIEAMFNLRPVIGPHTRRPGVSRPVAKATHKDWQAAERTKIPVESVVARIKRAWEASCDGQSFASELETRGLSLASGRRGIVVVDEAGTPHSIGRRLGLKAAEVTKRLQGINVALLPSVDEAKGTKGGQIRRKTMNMMARPTTPAQVDVDEREPWWTAQGYAAARKWDCVIVDFHGAELWDYGDRMELHCDGEPTDEQIEALVRNAKLKGWDGIHFEGGSPEWQVRARAEAIRQGFPPEKIGLEIDGFIPRQEPKSEPIPEHMRRRLGLATDQPDEIDHPADHPCPAA
ncbi:MAG: relaxase/mobilization nuclease domain-containing protein [Alphaproteobacteria bacterium]|nr:relaxase/mobilization nuclease domain-containing protein [Alphaproteobacteria bacterium]